MDIISYLLGKNAGGGGGGSLQELTVTPTNEEQVMLPEEGYTGFSKVTVGAIPEPIIPPDAGVLESIVVGSLPDKTTYIEGEPLDLTGCVILGNFSNGYQLDVTSGCTFICNDPVTYYDTKITAKYVVLDLEKTIDIPITVNGIPQQAPATTVVLAHFNDSMKNEVTGTNLAGTYTVMSGKFNNGQKTASSNTTTYNNWSISLDRTNGCTVEFWAKKTTDTSAAIALRQETSAPIFCFDSSHYITDTGFYMQYVGTNQRYASQTIVKKPTEGLDPTKFYHYAFVWTATDFKFFLNGELMTTAVIGTLSTTLSINQINWNGTIDELLACNEAKYLTDFEPPHGPYYLAEE